ncbi:MAG: NAD-dependent epimerase/dehydratase family protein [Clostridia bacterium]|nr:NAD-dependent epimerase/dehydratase family protein [Clostridia bacterium]
MKKILMIGGTGTISMAITRRLARDSSFEVWLLNRGKRESVLPEGVRQISADIRDEEDVKAKLAGMSFDAVADFIVYLPEEAERDWRLFRGRVGQYLFTSSASAYQKPLENYLITEKTPLVNPYWQYSRNKAACEDFLFAKYREEGFPVTVVRPSHTYDEKNLPFAVTGRGGCWTVLSRMLAGKPVIVHGDGSSLWHVTFNEDFARGYTGLLANPAAVGEAFHITGDEVLTWDQIYGTAADALGVPFRPYHVSSDFLVAAGKSAGYDWEGGLLGDKSVSVVFDNGKIKKLVPDMGTTIPFREGVERALRYLEAHPERKTEDPAFDNWCDRVIEAAEDAKKRFQ